MKRLILGLMIVASAAPAYAEVYKCTEGGKTVFSQIPCAPDAKVVNVAPVGSGISKNSTQPSKPFVLDVKAADAMTPDQIASKATAVAQMAEVKARECDWDIKVTKKHTPCIEFISYLRGEKYSEALALTGYMAEKYPDYKSEKISQLLRSMDTVNSTLDLMNAKY